jgi:glycosyltransferase involved in cell wall biosynthesis
MPTANRRKLLPLAIASFLSQDWPDKELIVIDDSPFPEGDLFVNVAGCTYLHTAKMTIGAKRNLACEMASGDVILHFDSDDWSAPGRVRDQVERMVDSGKQVSGYHTLLFWNTLTSRAYKYVGSPDYSCGTALCYSKSFWEANRFPDKDFDEDNHMVRIARAAKQIVADDGCDHLVCRVHETNITQSSKRVGNNCWPEVTRDTVPAAFFEALQ